MTLWSTWFACVCQLKSATSHIKTFLWMVAVLLGFTLRTDQHGVTSFVRALNFKSRYYECFTDFFHSNAISLDRLRIAWVSVVFKMFKKFCIEVNGRMVLVGDGLKIPKEGKKMPGLKLCHQESSNSSKAEYAIAHSHQVLQLLVKGLTGSILCVPLVNLISEGIRSGPRDKKTIYEKLIGLLKLTSLKNPFYIVLDAYYACKPMILPLLAEGQHLVSRVRKNAVAYRELTPEAELTRQRGRPKKYGEKITLGDVYKKQASLFQTAQSPLPNEEKIEVQFFSQDLIWKPVGKLIRFVWVKHPVRGKVTLFTTDLTLPPIKVLSIYGLRFRIEVSLRKIIHTLGGYAYHFWVKTKDTLVKKKGDLYLHRKSPDLKEAIQKKLNAYELFIQLALIAQGLLQLLALCYQEKIWSDPKIWMRTMNRNSTPSEWVTMQVMKNQWPDFYQSLAKNQILKKFLFKRTKPPDLNQNLAA